MIRIDTNELDKFAVEVLKLSDKTEENVKKVLKNSAFNIEANAKKNLNSNKSVVTGHLSRGITTDIKGLEATIHTSNIKYAPMVEYGTKAHVIKAKNKTSFFLEVDND